MHAVMRTLYVKDRVHKFVLLLFDRASLRPLGPVSRAAEATPTTRTVDCGDCGGVVAIVRLAGDNSEFTLPLCVPVRPGCTCHVVRCLVVRTGWRRSCSSRALPYLDSWPRRPDHNMFKWIPAGNGSASWTSVASLPPGSSTLNDHSGRPAFQRPQATSTQHQAPSPTPPIPVRSTPERRGYGQAPDIRKRRWRLSIPACALPPAVKDVSGEGV